MKQLSDAFFQFFSTLPLQGPGSTEDTLKVLNLINADLPTDPAVVDFGCGTGRSTLVLARSLQDATITALDKVPLFIDVLRKQVDQLGLGHRVRPVVGDMLAPLVEPGTLNLIWSEGAAYAVGLEAALRAWRPLLQDEGCCVLSECEWVSADRPAEVAAFWAESYPAMGDQEQNIQRAQAAGYKVLGTHTLSDSGWENYYGAITSALASMPAGALPKVLTEGLAREVEIRRQAEGCFGYVFYVLQPRKV